MHFLSHTRYNTNTPVILGTSILHELIQDCKHTHEERYLQTARIHTPWYIAFRAIKVREKALSRNKNRVAIVRSAEAGRIVLGPDESKNNCGYTDREIDHQATCAILQESHEPSLPSSVDITPAVIQYEYKKNKEVIVNVTNLTTNSVAITPKSILCEMQPVKVDESVFFVSKDNLFDVYFTTLQLVLVPCGGGRTSPRTLP